MPRSTAQDFEIWKHLSVWGTGIGWIDVKGGKWVKKKDKLANCFLTLWESYIIVEPSLPTISYSTKLRSSDRSSGGGCPANNLTWPLQLTLPVDCCMSTHACTCTHAHWARGNLLNTIISGTMPQGPSELHVISWSKVLKNSLETVRHARLIRIRSYLSLYLLSVTSTWPSTHECSRNCHWFEWVSAPPKGSSGAFSGAL